MKKTSNLIEKFGSYIRRLRMKNDIGQRELAKKIGIAPSYLNDIEKNKRTAPRIELIKKLSVILKADLDLLYDLAGNSKKTVAPDILNFIENNPRIISLLRAAKNSKLNDDDIEDVKNSPEKLIPIEHEIADVFIYLIRPSIARTSFGRPYPACTSFGSLFPYTHRLCTLNQVDYTPLNNPE